MFETPINFNTNIERNKFKLSYSNLMEIGQGGPEIGRISINGKLIENYYFGGPILFDENNIYIPAYIKRLVCYKFKLATISIEDVKTEIIGPFKNLIFLDRIENGFIIYYEDINKKTEHKIKINT